MEEKDYNLVVKKIISKINDTLQLYRSGDVITANRTSSIRHLCKTFDDYVECRFNYECSKLPELNDLIERTNGELFTCSLEDANVSKKRFKKATITIREKWLLTKDENLKNEITDLMNWLNGDTIIFTHRKTKFKFYIINSKVDEK